ncbi:AAC(3) family N-acetyltransferase [Embleya sp. NPDC005575]|uniref:AAC(3) family N-acetyltransferase n=1 Tax=Embleya sp. NPDC005575 TaxID=3156892 RepID=UPI00339FFD47
MIPRLVGVRLTAQDFGELARGRPGPAALQALRTGQLSRRLLLVHTLARTARTRFPSPWRQSGGERAQAVLTEVTRHDRGALESVLMHPHLGVWAMRCLRGLHGRSPGFRVRDELAWFTAVAAAAATRAGLPVRLELPVRAGIVSLPTLGSMRVPAGIVVVRLEDGVIHLPGGKVRVPIVDAAAPARDPRSSTAEDTLPYWQPARVVTARAPDSGPVLRVVLEDGDPYRDAHREDIGSPLTPERAARWDTALRHAWAVLCEHFPDRARICASLCTSVVPLAARSGRAMSVTVRDAHGAIGITETADPVRLAETLVHEASHIALGALTDLVDLHEGDATQRYTVGWRPDRRPLEAVLQGTYAHLALTGLWGHYRHLVPPVARARAERRFVRYRDQVDAALAALGNCRQLTVPGRRFVDHMVEEAADRARDAHDAARVNPRHPGIVRSRPVARTASATATALTESGLGSGSVLLVLAPSTPLGGVDGGPDVLTRALREVLGERGTLVVPTATSDNTDPSTWHRTCHSPVPADWWPGLRSEMPPFEPERTPSHRMGALAEHVRRLPGAVRSDHPRTSFAGIGPHASALMRDHAPDCHYGERSPLGRMEQAGAHVLLWDVGFAANITFHLAEYRLGQSPTTGYRSLVRDARGDRRWVEAMDTRLSNHDFAALGEAFERTGAVRVAAAGQWRTRLFRLDEAVGFATNWLREHRPDR